MNLPGFCQYHNPQTTKPEILKEIPLPIRCNKEDCLAAIHFYNHKKRQILDAINAGNSYSSISRRVKSANRIRWQAVTINTGIVYTCIKREPKYEQFIEGLIYHLHRVVDRFDPTRGFAPSTYFMTATKRHIWRMQNGNANQQNMNLVMASEMTDRHDQDGFRSAFEDRTTDLRQDVVIEEVTYREKIDHVTALMDEINDDRDREVIKMRFFSEMTLAEIADVLAITEERVRQLETRAMKDMKRAADRNTFKANRARYHVGAESHLPWPVGLLPHPSH